MKAIIMAGGSGSRLRPLTCDIPKPMVSVMNRPLMEYTLELLKLHGVKEAGATLQYMPEKIRDYLGDGAKYGLSLEYFVEEEPLGTAGSVKNAASFLDETFIVVSGDALTDFDLSSAMDFHRKKGAMATLVLTPVNTPLEYGVVITDPDGHITRFVEKPGWGEVFSDTVNTGIYILEPEVLNFFDYGQVFDFSKDLFPLLLERGDPLFGCVLPGYWCDIGGIDQYCQAHYDALAGKVGINFIANEVEPGIWIEEDADINPKAHLQAPVYIGAESYIGSRAYIRESVIGSENYVEELSSIKRGITWNGVCLEKKSALRGGILCRGVRLEPRASVYEEAVVGDGGVLEEGTVVKPKVKIWPEKRVESGCVLKDNLIWGNSIGRRLFGVDGVRGELNRDILPENALRLGAAYGSTMKNKKVVVSHDGHHPSLMLVQAITSGLLSSGVDVIEAGDNATPVLRQFISTHNQAGGGVQVSLVDNDPFVVRLRFLDNDGLNVGRNRERSIEQLYFRDDYARVSASLTGNILSEKPVQDMYVDELLSGLQTEAVINSGIRIVVGYPSHLVEKIISSLAEKINCRFLTLNIPDTPINGYLNINNLKERRNEISSAVRGHKAHLGVMINPDGEEMILFDERGCLVEGERARALNYLLLFRSNHGRGGMIPVPVNSSGVVDQIAQRYGGEVYYTRTGSGFQASEGDTSGEKNNGGSGSAVGLDCFLTLVRLLELMAIQESSFSSILSEIPPINLCRKEAFCSWNKKGIVMRKLIEENAGGQVEMIDGLKVHHPEGWALVLPDPEKPSYHVYGEGYNEEVSASLANFYVKKIDNLKK